MIVPPFQSIYIIYNDFYSKYKGVALHFLARGNAGFPPPLFNLQETQGAGGMIRPQRALQIPWI
jgi:hypothetical protein